MLSGQISDDSPDFRNRRIKDLNKEGRVSLLSLPLVQNNS